MKSKLCLCLALVLLAGLTSLGVSVIEQLRPDNISDSGLSVKVSDTEGGKRFVVFYKTNESTLDVFLHPGLDVYNETGLVVRSNLPKTWTTNGVQFEFVISNACLPASKFGLAEDAHVGQMPIPAFVDHWFYVRDFVTNALPSQQHAASAEEFSAEKLSEDYLNACGTNEIRCLWFLDNNPRVGMVMTIDLDRQTVFTVREVYNFAAEAAETRTLSHSQVLNLKEMMNALPMPDSDNDFSESVFVSVRSGERTLVFRYNRRYIPPTVRRIYDIAGGYLESSNTTSYDGKDLGAALRKIAEEISELAVDSITNAPALPTVAWNGDAVARAFFLMPKHLRYRTNIMERGPRQIAMADLEVTAVRYDSSKDAEQAVKGSLGGRQVAPQSKENYRGFTLYRFAPEYGTVICQAGDYVVEIDPLSKAAETMVMKTLDVVLGGLPKIAGGSK